MQLKRLFDREDPLPGPHRVKIVHLGNRQKFSFPYVARAVVAGWMTLAKGRVVIHSATGDVVFRIKRTPGLWCCHCRTEFGDTMLVRQHVITTHFGVPSPDRNNPAGYEQLNAFDCERE